MDILILYATYSSGTEIACQTIEGILKQHNHTITRKMVKETPLDELTRYDLIILGSPSWDYEGDEGQPHQDFINFITTNSPHTLPSKKFAVIGLGDSTYAHFCGAVDHLENFVKQVKGELLLPSLRVDGFYFNQEKNLEQIKQWAQEIASMM